MKVKQETRANLVIEDFPLFPGVISLPAALFVLYKVIERVLKNPAFDMETAGGIVAFFGFFFAAALFSEYRVFDFRIYQQKLFWKRLGLLGKKVGEVSFESIKNVVLETRWHSKGTMMCRLAIVTDDKKITLTRYYAAGSKDNCETIRNTILNTLKRDASDAIEESIREMLVSGQKIEAIKLARETYKISLKEAKELIEDLMK